MGLHRDADEKDFAWPVLSISLGDPARLPHRRPPRAPTRPPRSCSSRATSSSSAATARLAYHGIDRIRAGGSRLLPEGGRINLTCRVVD